MAQAKVTAKAVKEKVAAAKTRKVRAPKNDTKAEAPKGVNAHIAAGLKSNIDGSNTPLLNDNRPTRIEVLETAKMTDRRQKGLYQIRECYGNKPFPARGLNHGIMRTLLAEGLISVKGGMQVTEGSKTYVVDGEQPVMAQLTAAGQKYGKS